MRAPPPVELSTSQAAGWRLLQAVLVAAAAGSLTLWLAERTWGPRPSLGALAVPVALLAGVLAFARSRRPVELLRWTGQRWQLVSAAQIARDLQAPEVMIDLGQWMLLRCRPQDRGVAAWLTVQKGSDALRWAAWRAAVYSPATRSSGSSLTEPPSS